MDSAHAKTREWFAYPYAPPWQPNRYLDPLRLPYKLFSYKGRFLDRSREVQVYRNLHGDRLHTFSIRQAGRVVAHAEALMLSDARFVVQQLGRERCVRQGRKNVHAWIAGRLSGSAMGTCLERKSLPVVVTYDPQAAPTFLGTLGTLTFPLRVAAAVMLKPSEITAAYTG